MAKAIFVGFDLIGPRVIFRIVFVYLYLFIPQAVNAHDPMLADPESFTWRENFHEMVLSLTEFCTLSPVSDICQPIPDLDLDFNPQSNSRLAKTNTLSGETYQLFAGQDIAEAAIIATWQVVEKKSSQIADDIFTFIEKPFVRQSVTPVYFASMDYLDQLSRSPDQNVRRAVYVLADQLMQRWFFHFHDRWVHRALFDDESRQIYLATTGVIVGSGVTSVKLAHDASLGAQLTNTSDSVVRNRLRGSLEHTAKRLHFIRRAWPIRWFSHKLPVAMLLMGTGIVWARDHDRPALDIPPSPAHLIHFNYQGQPGMGSECVFANSDCDSFHGDRESRGHAKLVSGIGGFVAAGWFAVPWRWTPVGLVLGFAVDYGLYNGWRQFQFKKAYNLLEESLDSLILKMQSLNFQSASLKEKLLAEETLSKAMAEVFARMNIMEVAALSEAEVNYQIQLKLLDLLVDFELESESSLDGKITQLHSRLRQLKEQVQQSRDLWDVDIDDHALNSLLEFLSQRDCWLEDWSSREKDILSSDDSVLRSCPRRYGGGSRKAWWKQTLGRLVSAIDMDLFNSFRRELSRVRVLKEKLKQVTEKFKTRLKTAGHETLAYEIATSGVMVVSMLEARLATLDIEEHFLKQFIGANNSRPNNGKEVVDRLKRILSPLGPL